jgi:hypothetical protein
MHDDRGDDGNGQGVALAPGMMPPLPMTTTPTIMTRRRQAIAAGWEGGTRRMQNCYNGNEDREECKIRLSHSLKEMDLWKVWYMELREE